MPLFDLSRLLEEDKATEGLDLPYRFGKSFDVNLGLKDGKWQKTDSAMVWSLKIASDNAYSLNFIFSELYLPQEGKMYIYNEDGSAVYGPVTDRQNKHGTTFLTDIIQGESVTIFISVPKEKQPLVKLTIQNVIHGYKNLFEPLVGYGDSDQSPLCNGPQRDAACYSMVMGDAIDGIVQILLADGTELCSGSLLNNTAQDFKPYVLTAFHCIDIGDPTLANDTARESGFIDADEIVQAEHWLVRFRFMHTVCGGNTIAAVRTFSNTFFRAAWNTTDFALVELQADILRDEPSVGEKVWLGWDRTGNSPTKGYFLHHPEGDVMKYAYDSDAITETSYLGTSGQSHWHSKLDIGLLEKGSSGSPIFDQNKRVVGQLHGGYPNCNGPKEYWHGCLYRSWTGGGTNTTRLSNWLNPTGSSATTLNSMRQPVPEYSTVISNLCSAINVSITNLAPGYFLHHWNGSSNVSFPNGNTSNPVQISPGADGSGWIEAVYHTGWGTVTMDRMYFWVGDPLSSDISLVIQDNLTGQQVSQYMLCPNTGYIFTCNNSNNQCSTSNYNWNLPYGMSLISSSQNWAYVNTNSSGGGILTVTAQTCCNSNVTILSELLGVDGYDCGYYMMISPNPSNGEVTISILSKNGDDEVKSDFTVPWDVHVISVDRQVEIVKETKLEGNKYKLNTSGWKQGVYVVQAKYKDKILEGKLMVK